MREALAAGGNLPFRHAAAAKAAAAVVDARPSAVILAPATADPDHTVAQEVADAVDACGGSIIPILGIARAEAPPYPLALPVAAADIAQRLVPRLRAALRVRALHVALLRRIELLADPADVPDTVDYDPIEDATVLVAGRGRNYPALTVAIGERMGLIGALALETARSYLAAREVDGIVIGDGFNRAMVEDFLNELGADPRWRDMPVVMPQGGAPLDPERLPNADAFGGGPEAVAAHVLPFARMHAFAARLKRVAASLDQKGTLAPDTGLMTHAAFMAELNRVAATAEARGAGLSLARLSFDTLLNRRASLDAARITGRLLRASDIACRDEDGSILIAFTETDLVTAHVVARRIASVLKHTTLSLGAERTRLGPTVALAAFRPRDTVETLVARTIDHRLVAAE
ncbi:MAG TPA: GGDEF domain-containing protein [Xanthobacteraceae bacterium]|nr:GGDEF domain-containing protein [Xanthobacteraceae bacterium]